MLYALCSVRSGVVAFFSGRLFFFCGYIVVLWVEGDVDARIRMETDDTDTRMHALITHGDW